MELNSTTCILLTIVIIITFTLYVKFELKKEISINKYFINKQDIIKFNINKESDLLIRNGLANKSDNCFFNYFDNNLLFYKKDFNLAKINEKFYVYYNIHNDLYDRHTYIVKDYNEDFVIIKLLKKIENIEL